MRLKPALLAFAIVTAGGLLNFSIEETAWLSEAHKGSAKYPFVWEMTGAYTFLILLPALIWIINRFPVGRRNAIVRIPLHVAVFVAYAVMHTLLMWGSRELIYRLLGWGTYDYGWMRYRFFMEGQKQLIIYVGLYALLRFIAYTRVRTRLERELTEARLAALKTQLAPHFLFNALNMIASHVHSDPDVAGAMLQNLSNFLRATLRNGGAHEVPLGQEIEFLDSYVAIMKARFEERLRVDVSLPADVRDTLVPHLLLQPLVENSIAHSLREHSRRAEISIAAERQGDSLCVTIDDNGPGIEATSAGSGEGIGLSNTIARLQHLYGERQRMTIANREQGGLRLKIELPWHTQRETTS